MRQVGLKDLFVRSMKTMLRQSIYSKVLAFDMSQGGRIRIMEIIRGDDETIFEIHSGSYTTIPVPQRQ
jgi:hypothetical protein